MKIPPYLRVAILGIGSGILTLPPPVSGSSLGQNLVWVAQAPGPNTDGQVENIKDGEVVGAIEAVAVHPTDANIVYVGAVNGGVWKTDNATAASPTWKSQTDGQNSLSIGALKFDPTDATNRTLVAGTGCFSSFRMGGARVGLLRTTDGGASWTGIDGGGVLKGLNISGVVPRGATIVVSANSADNSASVGIWRSVNTGGSWTKISGAPSTKLPTGEAFDLAGDPTNRDRLFTNAGRRGLYRSADAGGSWTKVSNTAMDDLIASANNIKIAVGVANNVYVAIVGSGRLTGVFRSGDSGTNWTNMDLPTTAEGGLEPGDLHLSVAADLSNANIVYIGGACQAKGSSEFPFPNSIGARDYSGHLFRGDVSRPTGRQWVHLTHSNRLGAAGGGTASCSAPHADSRGMAVTIDGTLIEVDDGGIYQRTSPQTNAGDWFSMNGDIQVAEFHAVAWDHNSHIVVGGAQDTGTPEQRLRSSVLWRSVSNSDGGVVGVDCHTPLRSTRYSSYYDFKSFRRQVYDAANVFQSEDFPALRLLDASRPLMPQFYTPIRVNTINPNQLIIGGANSVYESLDQGETINEIGPGIVVNDTGRNSIAYGAAGNSSVLYIGSGNHVYVRTAPSPATLKQSTAYPGGTVAGVAIDPNSPKTAYAIDTTDVYRTIDAGGTWKNITGNLAKLVPDSLYSIDYSTHLPEGAVILGSATSVFIAPGPAFSKWDRFGTGLPSAPVLSVEYDSVDGIVLAGTLGRGAWTMALSATSPSEAKSISSNSGPGKPLTAPAPKSPGTIINTGVIKNLPTRAKLATDDKVAVRLGPGVIVDPVAQRVYIMSPKGGVDAVELSHGELVWDTAAAAKPLAVVGQYVVSQAESTGEGNDLKIVVMDRESGRQTRAGILKMPTDVKPSVIETSGSRFVASARAADGGADVTWQFAERRKTGVKPDTRNPSTAKMKPVSDSSPHPAETNSKSGTFHLNLSTGAASPINKAALTSSLYIQAASVPPEDYPPGVEGTPFISEDRRHVLFSRDTGDDQAWAKYDFTFYDRDTKERVGGFKSHTSTIVPFFVTNSLVIYETNPYVRQTEAGLLKEPLKIRAVDLKTGEEIWSREVRDTLYRGPLPP